MIFFSSDHHFYHKNIIKYCNRPFETVEEMNEEMVKRWNEVVAKEDIVYYLGDFSLAIRPVELFLNRLNGTKILMAGNHDFCHPVHPKSKTLDKHQYWLNRYEELGFQSIHYERYLNIIDGTTSFIYSTDSILMTHMPYLNADNKDERYPQYRPIDEGKVLLHGHVHDKWKIKDKMINVGVDVWDFYPVSFDTISQIIRETECLKDMNIDEDLRLVEKYFENNPKVSENAVDK